MSAASGLRPDRRTRPTGRALLGALVALALAVVPAVFVATPAQAATATVSLSSSAATAESNTPVTFTVSVTCNGPGTCNGAQVSFPKNAVTGNGTRTDLSTWVGASSCGSVTRTVTATDVVFTYATLSPGTQNCTFPVRAPEYTTLNGAVATLTPTVSGPGLTPVSGTPVNLTLTAGHNVSTSVTGPSRILSGQTYGYSIIFNCGALRQYDGDIGVSALHLETTLPAGFVYSSYTPRNSFPGTYTPPAVGSSGGTFVYDDPTGASCSTPLLNVDNAVIIVVYGSFTAPVGTQACLSATHTFTYIDRTTPETTSGTTSPCPTVVNLATAVSKTATVQSMGNVGQYLFAGARYPYTFPGDWDQSQSSLSYAIKASTNPGAIAAGISYEINDPLPCLDNLSGIIYSSNASGVLCANPGFIPVRVTASGFTPVAANQLHLLRADGTTLDVPYAAGGWTIPTAGSPISEIQFPPFTSEGSNTAAVITFTVDGYASTAAVPGRVLRNTMTSQAHLSDTGDAIGTVQTATANAGVVDRLEDAGEHGNPVLTPLLTSTMTSACVATVGLRTSSGRGNQLELTKAPTEQIYVSYLAPEGATIGTATVSPTFRGIYNGRNFAAGALVPSVTPDYNGTGRTLYNWTVPAGVITVPGLYDILNFNLSVNLGAGCAGTYESDMTLGYESAITKCIWTNFVSPFSQDAPLDPMQNPDLRTNGGPISGNYCGISSPITVAAINPGFSIDKNVQGSLDAAPAAVGTTGKVGTSGGEATYSVTFSNSGESVLTDPVLYDLLPRVGDTEATSTTPRDSQFAATLASLGTLPAGVSVEYSTAENPCRPEVLDDNPGCVTDWNLLPPAPLSSTTALRFVFTGSLQVPGGGGTTSFTVSYDVITPAITAGRIAWNSVGANAYAGGSLIGAAESTSVGLEADGQPAIVKTSSTPTFDAVNDTVTFSYAVTNEASVPVTGVSVTDQFTDAAAGSAPGSVTCVSRTGPAAACSGASTDLAAGQSATFEMTYTIRQADLDHGLIEDRATVIASPSRGPALSNTSNLVTVTADQSPALTLAKSVSPLTVDAAGDSVSYSFLVTNTGNVTVDSVGVTETAFSGSGATPAASCPSGALAPAAFVTCTASYSITQDDMDAGVLDNTAVARAEFDGAGILSPSSSASVTVDQNPSLDLLKSALPATIGSAGQSITYSFLVTNDGNVTIDGIDVQETAFSGFDPLDPVVCPATELAPGDDMTCTTSYVATQADIDAGTIDNTATAIGDDPTGTPLTAPPTSNFSVTVVFAPSLTLVKTADVSDVDAVGDVIGYEFLVLNNGNTTLSDLTIDETAFTGAGTLGTVVCPITTLAPTDSTTCTADYTVVGADARGATISNTAQALATYALGGAQVSVSSTDSTAVVAVDPGVTPGLAATGSTAPRWLLALGALALLAGSVLLGVSRRRSLVGVVGPRP
jgi:uncharacterized repeat protein (TIGR01451 family)/LPXTG-motif cell wall-anchored protein